MKGGLSFLWERFELFFRTVRVSGWKTALGKTGSFLLYFLPTGKYPGIRRSPYYDRSWYLKTYLRKDLPWIDPLRHYVEAGWQFGHSPSEHFPGALYLFYHPELLRSGKCPLEDLEEKKLTPKDLTRMCRRFDGQLEALHRKIGWRRGVPGPPAVRQDFFPKVGIHLHCFYADMLPEIAKNLAYLPCGYDLYVSVPENGGVEVGEIEKFAAGLKNLRKCEIRQVPNRGRDVAPLIRTFGKQLADYDCVCHVHTKRSPHFKQNWSEFLLKHLFGDEEWLQRIFTMLANGTSIIYPRDFLNFIRDPSGWGENLAAAQSFLDRRGVAIDLKEEFPLIEFPQGCMFWARARDISDFLTLDLDYRDFPEEPIGTDGSLAHVLEHLLFVLVYRKCSGIFQLYRPEEAGLLGEKRYVYRELDPD